MPVPLGKPVRDMLEAMKAGCGSAVQIMTNNQGKPWTSDVFCTPWEKVVRKAGGVKLYFHNLGGTAVTRLALSCVTVPEIACITGHSFKTVLEILDRHYLGERFELAEAGINKLDAVFGLGTKLQAGCKPF